MKFCFFINEKDALEVVKYLKFKKDKYWNVSCWNCKVLEKYAEYKGTDIDQIRALTFRRAICALKCVPFKITNVKQLKNVKHVGEHTLSVVEV